MGGEVFGEGGLVEGGAVRFEEAEEGAVERMRQAVQTLERELERYRE